MTARAAKGGTFHASRLLVTQTYVVHRQRDREPTHYEIQLAETDEPRDRRLVAITKDKAVYELAHSIEGHPIRVDVTWKISQKWDGKPAQEITDLTCVQKATRQGAA